MDNTKEIIAAYDAGKSIYQIAEDIYGVSANGDVKYSESQLEDIEATIEEASKAGAFCSEEEVDTTEEIKSTEPTVLLADAQRELEALAGEKDAEISKRDKEIEAKETEISKRDERIKALEAELAEKAKETADDKKGKKETK